MRHGAPGDGDFDLEGKLRPRFESEVRGQTCKKMAHQCIPAGQRMSLCSGLRSEYGVLFWPLVYTSILICFLFGGYDELILNGPCRRGGTQA